MCLEESLVRHCAPTLAALKVANMFRYLPNENEQPVVQFHHWDLQLRQRGIRLLPLKLCKNSGAYLLYVYREAALAKVLSDKAVRRFLTDNGYSMTDNCQYMLQQLSDRLCLNQEFPHEVGVFLGYPLGDILGFIRNKGKHYRCCGYWKVYENPNSAKRQFAQFKSCTKHYHDQYLQGNSVLQLATPTFS